jgi:hypothetical protein
VRTYTLILTEEMFRWTNNTTEKTIFGLIFAI